MDNLKRQFKYYSNYEVIFDYMSSNSYVYLGKKNNKKCRFCGETNPIQFRKVAHAFPELIGNKKLISYYECDKCNDKFSMSIEDHFGKFLGPSRTFSWIKGKKKIPSYKTRSQKSRIDYISDKGLEISNSILDPIVKIDKESNQFIFKGERQPYIPCAVYKCLTKMAISVLPESEIKHFENTIKWIDETNHENSRYKMKPLMALFSFTPGINPYRSIKALLLKRKDNTDSSKYPYMYFIIVFYNYFFQIIVPTYQKDKDLYHKKISLMFYPTPFDECFLEGKQYAEKFGKTIRRTIDLTSHELIKYEPINITIHFDRMEKVK